MTAAGFKLHVVAATPSCRRVLVYLAEKGLDVELVPVDLAAGEHRAPAFLARNPAGKVPLLETDDGRFLAEAAAIVEYVEEQYPAPPMIGVTALERVSVRAAERMAAELFILVSIMVRHGSPAFADRVVQNAALARGIGPLVEIQLSVLEARIGAAPFVAGDRPTIADCTLFPVFESCRRLSVPLGTRRSRLNAWYERFAQRSSTALK